jgi:hypothetical protein
MYKGLEVSTRTSESYGSHICLLVDMFATGTGHTPLSLLSNVGINAPMLSTDILLVYNRQYINLANKNTIYITI